MKKKSFRIVSCLVIVALVALLAVQALSLVNLYQSMNVQFRQKVQSAMERAAYDYLMDRSQQPPANGYTMFDGNFELKTMKITDIPVDVIDNISVMKKDTASYVAISTRPSDTLILKNTPVGVYVFESKYNRELNSFVLAQYDTLLQKNMADAGIEQYQLALTDHTLEASTTESLHDPIANPFTVTIPLDSKGAILCSVDVTNPSRLFLHDMQWIILSSALILALLCITFWYLLRTLFRQKTLEQMRNDFTHNITHELKTPIAVAYAANDAMLHFEADRDPVKRETYLTVVHDQLNALSDMVQRILTLSTQEEIDYPLTLSDCRLDQMLEAVCHTLKMKYGQELDFSTSLTPTTLMVHADASHFQSVLTNILDNAVKYSPEHVAVHITAEAVEDPKTLRSTVVIRITDQGIGISSADCAHIFEKFYRVPTGNLHNVKGSGLGLYYARLIIEKHGGTIEVTSTPGKGTTFILHMPA